MIGASVKTLRREIKEGKLRAHRLRRVLVIFVADWERYLAGLPVEPSAVDMVPAVSRADARPAMGGRIQRLFDPREVVG